MYFPSSTIGGHMRGLRLACRAGKPAGRGVFLTKRMNLKFINIISIAVPFLVLLLFQVKLPGDFSYLPHIYAPINAVVFILLLSALIAIKRGNTKLHKWLMSISVVLSALFLLMYLLYHATSEETKFGGEGLIRYFYYFVLLTHILLSVVVIPLVLRAYYFAYKGALDKHKKIVRFAYPIWLYVAFTGVLIYILIAPFYSS